MIARIDAASAARRRATLARLGAGLPGQTEGRRICGNNTRQGSTRKGILKPAGFLFLGFAPRHPDAVATRS